MQLCKTFFIIIFSIIFAIKQPDFSIFFERGSFKLQFLEIFYSLSDHLQLFVD